MNIRQMYKGFRSLKSEFTIAVYAYTNNPKILIIWHICMKQIPRYSSNRLREIQKGSQRISCSNYQRMRKINWSQNVTGYSKSKKNLCIEGTLQYYTNRYYTKRYNVFSLTGTALHLELSFDTIEPSLNFDSSVSLASVTPNTLKAGTYIKSI